MEINKPELKRERWDTHSFYRTTHHLHLTVCEAGGNMIDLLLVECENGKWFIEDSIGDLLDERVFQPSSKDFIEPKFYDDLNIAEKTACEVAAEHLKLNFHDIYPYFEEE
ncbi:hypothetical protein [Vibrio coralliilyticus]|uniref:hypothetical protein n=1 Tax=Vibrio coralliilyticus TaxID=190893 RepID=UPI000BAC27D4|nr:hypothetical protein [Vibrio coralliilyticus]PAW00410.1 hypothetical protein CKJ79_27095 [Vibrio coralliilyticus]